VKILNTYFRIFVCCFPTPSCKQSEYKAEASKKVALSVLEGGVETVRSLEALLCKYFPPSTPLSKVQSLFEDQLLKDGIEGGNSSISKAIPEVRDAIALCTANVQSLEAFIMLALPAMEDGGNFGVSIQLEVLKALKETRESWSKLLAEEFVTYYDARASAVEKFGIEKATTSSTTTSTQQTEKAKEETSKVTTTIVEETKTSGVAPQVPLTASWAYHRLQYVVALDIQLYSLLQVSLQQVINTYVNLLDSVQKNYSKLAYPKGTGHGRGNRHMMM
jgi:hypothetical protein